MSSTAGSLSLGRRPCGALSKHMFQGPEASEALLSQAGSFLLLLSAGVSLRTGGALQGGHRAHLVPPYVRQLTLAKAEKLGADVDLSCNMVLQAITWEQMPTCLKPLQLQTSRAGLRSHGAQPYFSAAGAYLRHIQVYSRRIGSDVEYHI